MKLFYPCGQLSISVPSKSKLIRYLVNSSVPLYFPNLNKRGRFWKFKSKVKEIPIQAALLYQIGFSLFIAVSLTLCLLNKRDIH